MNKVSKLKDSLLDTLIDQIQNGVAVQDKETGEIVKIPAPATLLSVAAKVVKDFHDEIGQEDKKSATVSDLLARYADRKAG